MIKKTPSDKDDYPQINKQESNPVNTVIDQVNDDIKRIRDKLNEIHHLTITQIMTNIIRPIKTIS